MSSSNKVPCYCTKCKGGLVSVRTERNHRNGPLAAVRQQPTERKRQKQDTGMEFTNLNLIYDSIVMNADMDDEMDIPPGPEAYQPRFRAGANVDNRDHHLGPDVCGY